MWRVTFVTFLGRIWRSRRRIFFVNLWHFLSHPSRKTSHFGPAGTKLFETGRNVTIWLGLKHSYLFPSQICHLSGKREAGRPFWLRPTLSPSRIDTFLPVQKSFVPAGPKCDVFWEGCDKKRHKLKHIYSCARASHSSQKCDASNFLSPGKVTNVTSLTQIWDGKLGRNPGKTDPY